MAVYTTMVSTICASLAGFDRPMEYRDADLYIALTWEEIFSGAWHTFDPDYKVILCKKILKHYWMREIGMETVGLFLHYLNTRLEEIMPYYNKMYESASYEFNPLHDYEVTHTSQRTQTGDTDSTITNEKTDDVDSTSSSTSNATNSVTGKATNSAKTTTQSDSNAQSINKFSDTPQGALNGAIEGNYLTNATVNDNTDNKTGESETNATVDTTTNAISDANQEDTRTETRVSNSTGTEKKKATTTEDYVMSIVGKTGGKSYSKLIAEYRDTLVNIDMLIINELSDLFMGLWA